MLFNIGDKFLINGLETSVRYINNDMAWVSSDENPHVVIDVINKKGLTDKGFKVKAIVNSNCGAV